MDVPISVVVALLAAAIPAGVALGKLAAHEERLKSLERMRERTGARLEQLEKRVAVDRVRHATAAKGVAAIPPAAVDDEGSGEHG